MPALVPAPTAMDLTLYDMARSQPEVSLTIGAILHLEGTAPALTDLRAHLAGHLRRLPRLTHYLKDTGRGAGWAYDADPDLGARVREERLEPGRAHLDAALRAMLTRPLPSEGPRWDVWLLHGHAPGRYTLCYRAHHTSHDGAGLINVLHALFGAPVSAPARTPAAPLPRARPGDYTRTLTATLGSFTANNLWNDPHLPLRNERASSWARVPTDVLRATAAARGGSGYDAVLAALASALRTWSGAHWPRAAGQPVPAVMMVDLRRPQEAERPGNLFTFAPVALPCHLPDPAARLDAVISATRGPKLPTRRAALRTVTDRTPAWAFRALATRLTSPSRAIIDTSHVEIRRPLHYRGDPVTAVQAFTWLPRHHPASVVTCGYQGTTSAYFVTDAALPGLHQLPRLWQEAATRGAAPS